MDAVWSDSNIKLKLRLKCHIQSDDLKKSHAAHVLLLGHVHTDSNVTSFVGIDGANTGSSNQKLNVVALSSLLCVFVQRHPINYCVGLSKSRKLRFCCCLPHSMCDERYNGYHRDDWSCQDLSVYIMSSCAVFWHLMRLWMHCMSLLPLHSLPTFHCVTVHCAVLMLSCFSLNPC